MDKHIVGGIVFYKLISSFIFCLLQQDTSPPHPKSPIQSDTEMPYCVAIYDFPGETPDDLSFVVGDRIDLLEHVGADWLKGSLHGKTGMFPTAFVEIRKDLTGKSSMA